VTKASPHSITATEQVRRWLTSFGIVGLRAERAERRIYGLAGLEMLVGSQKSSAGSFTEMVQGDTRKVRIRFVPQKGQPIEDSLVVLRLNQFAPMFQAWIEQNSHRLYGEE
jgi:hypothetical protein